MKEITTQRLNEILDKIDQLRKDAEFFYIEDCPEDFTEDRCDWGV